MRFARSILHPLGVLFLALLLICALPSAALADDRDPVEFTIQIAPDSLTGPGEVSVSLRVANPTEKDMIAPVTLYDPAGAVVASFGDGGSVILKSGDSRPWEGKWNVTQAQLDAGAVTYTLRYHLEDETGSMVELSRQASARVRYDGQHVSLTVNRAIRPEVVRSGGQVTVTYELYNNGNVDLTDIRVQETVSKTAKTVKALAAGERATVEFTSHAGSSGLTSSASITYKAAGETKTYTEKVEEAAIPLAKPNLKLELSCETKGVNIGEAAVLAITFTNAGNVTYSNVTVSEAKRGEILTNVSIPAGATVTEQKEFILMEPADFKVTATLPDNTGETRTMTSNEVHVGVFDPEKQLLLTLNLTADQDTVATQPADVQFHLTVTNNSNIKAEKIAISHGDVRIYTIEALEPGESVTLDRDVRISQAGQFRFTATLKDSMKNDVSFDSNTLRIVYAKPTAAPTTVPVVTVAPPQYVTDAPVDPLLQQGRSILFTAAIALTGLFGCALVLFAVSTLIRMNKKQKSKAAFDHLDLAERRDYTEPEEAPEAEPETDAAADDDADWDAPIQAPQIKADKPARELPHEKLLKNAAKAQPAAEPDLEKTTVIRDRPAEPDLEKTTVVRERPAAGPELEKTVVVRDRPAADGEGGYRVSRAPSDGPRSSYLAQAMRQEAARTTDGNADPEPQPQRHRRSARRVDDE